MKNEPQITEKENEYAKLYSQAVEQLSGKQPTRAGLLRYLATLFKWGKRK